MQRNHRQHSTISLAMIISLAWLGCTNEGSFLAQSEATHLDTGESEDVDASQQGSEHHSPSNDGESPKQSSHEPSIDESEDGEIENFYDIKARKDAYFAKMRQEKGDGAFEGEASEYRHYQEWLRFWEPRLAPSGSFAKYGKAEKRFFDALAANQIARRGGQWREIGPTKKPELGIENMGGSSFNAEVGVGPIEFIEFFDAQPRYMLAGSIEGGLFYSTNYGGNWEAASLQGWITRNGVSSAAYDPLNRRIVYAASSRGEGSEPKSIAWTGGIFRTDNIESGSAGWRRIADHNTFGSTSTQIFKVVAAPDRQGRIYAATSKGLFRTDNALDPNPTWRKLFSGMIFDFEVEKEAWKTCYATVFKDNKWSVMISKNLGNGLKDIPNQPTYVQDDEKGDRATIEIARGTDYLYYFIKGMDELHRYNTKSKVWELMSRNHDPLIGSGHGFGVAQADANRVFLSDYITYKSSLDGGKTWTGSDGTGIHVDVEDIVPYPLNNTNEVWMATHGGVHVSYDNGRTWRDRSNGLGVAQVMGVANAPDNPELLMGGLYHDGTVLSVGDYNASHWRPQWSTVQDYDGMQCAFDYQDPRHLYLSGQFGRIFHHFHSGGGTAPKQREFLTGSHWRTTMKINTRDPKTIYAAGRSSNDGQQVLRWSDRGAGEKEQISNFDNSIVYRIHTTPADSEVMYAFVRQNDRSKLFYNTRIESSPGNVQAHWWEIILPSTTTTEFLSDVEIDRNDPYSFWLTYASSGSDRGLVYRYDGNTGQWTDLTKNLSTLTSVAGSIVQEGGPAGGLYVSTDFGVFYADRASLNGSEGWSLVGEGLPQLSGLLEIQEQAKVVRIGTRGRGFWEHDLIDPAM